MDYWGGAEGRSNAGKSAMLGVDASLLGMAVLDKMDELDAVRKFILWKQSGQIRDNSEVGRIDHAPDKVFNDSSS